MRLRRIFDSQETASIKEARKLLVEKAGMTDEQADAWVRGDLRAAFPILRDKKAAKFILGTTRLFVEQQLNNADAQNKMSKVLKEINSAHYDEYNRNLNNESLQDLYSKFKSKFETDDAANREASNSKQFGKSDYTIHGPYDSFEQAEEEWGNNSQDWCVFHDEDAYISYTSAGQRFYVAAQNGWKHIRRVAGEDAPKDAYGNSLIAVSVDADGNLATSTPRWNHANGGGDNTYIVEELEDIIQMPFYETFEPYTEEERRERGIISFEEAAERLASGEDPHNIFGSELDFVDGFAKVVLNYKYNFIDVNNKLLSDQWFDAAGDFCDGFAKVEQDYKYNFINTDGKILSDQWFDNVWSFSEGFADVQLNDKHNFVDTKGNLLSDQWFDVVGNFSDGYATVNLDDKCNFIDSNGKLLFSQWVDDAYHFKEGFAPVKLRDKWNFMDTKGNLLSDQWFDDADYFHDGFACVRLNGKYNFMDTKGNFLSDQWFDLAYAFKNGFAKVELNDKVNFIDTKGKLLSKTWFDFAVGFKDGVVRVLLNDRWHHIDESGKMLDSVKHNLNCKRIFSILDATKRQKETITNWATKAGKNPDEVIRWAESNFKKDADQLAAAKWYISGYNTDIFEQALYICSQKKLDPLKQNPEQLAEENADLKQKEKPINPDDVLTDRKDEGDGVVTYAARDEDRETIRQIINTHFGANANPWCLMQSVNGKLTAESASYWKQYSAYPKRIAFLNGKLIAFSAGTKKRVREWWDRLDRSFPFVPYNGKVWVGKSGYSYEIKDGDVLKYTSDKSIRSHLSRGYSESIENSEADVIYYSRQGLLKIEGVSYYVDHEDDKYLYVNSGGLKCKLDKDTLTFEGEFRQMYDPKHPMKVCTYKNGKLEGMSCTYNPDGSLYCEMPYKNGKKDGHFVRYYENGSVEYEGAFKNDVKDGMFKSFYEDGSPSHTETYVNGALDGKQINYNCNGDVTSVSNYSKGMREGEQIAYYDNGDIRFRYNCVHNEYDGRCEKYYENGNMEYYTDYKDGKREGEYKSYFASGKVHNVMHFKNDVKEGPFISYYDNGVVAETGEFKDGDLEGLNTIYYPSGKVKEKRSFKRGLFDGPRVWYDEKGSAVTEAVFKDGNMVKRNESK